MAAAIASKRLFRVSTPEAIEPDLAALWRDLAQTDAPIARAVMSNLVVFRDRIAPPDTEVEAVTSDLPDLPLEEVLARHPSRLIVLEHERAERTSDVRVAAGVAIAVFGPPHARYGVEQIVTRSACGEASLPSIVRRFLRGDLPTTVWWTEDLSLAPPLAALVTMGRQLLYDSRQWRDVAAGVRTLAPLVGDRYADLADLNWRRLTPLRRALDAIRRASGLAAALPDAKMRIAHRAGDAPLAWLLAGALMAEQKKPVGQMPAVDQSAPDGTVLLMTLRRGSSETTITLTSERVVVDDGSGVPLVISAPAEPPAEAIAAELRMLSQDAALGAAIRALDRHFNAR
jgi:glucose-6-phosphate dehydrogenase assembly protein OpcA